MIQQQTILKIIDNSGAKTVKCIKVLGGFKKKVSKLGEVIVVSVQQLRNRFKNKSKVRKGEIYKALIVKTKIGVVKKSGYKETFTENSAILINKSGNPVGTRIIGPLTKNLKLKKNNKFISISSGLV
uniref:ribosomal protein L14 n=1 Tax=Cocconeiopsis kantsiensis TaxID=3082010 RepID=UPI0030030982